MIIKIVNIKAEPDNRKGKKRNKRYKSVFMEGVPGVKPFHEEPQLTELQRKVREMCGAKR